MTKPNRLGLRLLSLILCFACVLPVFGGRFTAKADENAKIMTTVVRYSASGSSTVIGQMTNGTEVTVLGERRGFYKVDCYDMTGYIAKTQVEHTNEGKYYVNCSAESGETLYISQVDHSDALTLRHSLYSLAKKQLGSRYSLGSARPGAFDCSGLTSYLYKQHGIDLYRTASTQLQNGVVVAKEGLQVGDLVFFRINRGAIATHVGIYVGDNRMIHAGNGGVEYAALDSEYYSKYYLCARRVVNTGTALLENVSAARSTSGLFSVSSISGRTVR